MKKILTLLFFFFSLTSFADTQTFTVNVTNNSGQIFPPGVELYLSQINTTGSSPCQIFWPNSQLANGSTDTFTVICQPTNPFIGIKMQFISAVKQVTSNGQTQYCWGTYSTSQSFIGQSTLNLNLYYDFQSFGRCTSNSTIPPVLNNNPQTH